jgi:beta-lactamase regulating signal transducer with metallopeptidase domain
VEVLEGDLRTTLDRLVPLAFADNRRVRLYLAPDVAAPVSFGLFRPSICVPPRAADELSDDEKETMLAHELAHLARRDPLWLSMAWLIERVFFFQPLNRFARAELHDVAELLCDDWAVTRTRPSPRARELPRSHRRVDRRDAAHLAGDLDGRRDIARA